MEPQIYSSDHCQFKSASFQNDEQFLRTLAKFMDCDSSWRKRIKDPTNSSRVASWFASTFAILREADRLCSRAEKIPMLRGCLPKLIEELLHRVLRMGLPWVTKTIDMERPNGLYAGFWGDYRLPYIFITINFDFYGDLFDDYSEGDYFSVLDEADHKLAHNAIVSVVVSCIVYQYLFGYVDRGGTKTYNPGSLEFRATYVSLLLFQGAYVWIKFREVAPRTAYRRSRTDERGQVQYYGKYEPRFTPPREEGFGKHNHLPLGGYVTEEDAKVVCQIAGFYYGKDVGAVALEDGSHFSIPEMSEQERSLCGEEKRKWVSEKAREVLKEVKEQNASRRPPSSNGEDEVGARGFSCSADQSAFVTFAPATANGNEEFLGGLSTLAQEHCPLMSVDEETFFGFHLDSADFLTTIDIPMPTFQEESNEQLHLQEKQLEADFNRRLAEEHEKRRRLEEENMELQQENLGLRQRNLEMQQECKRLKTMLQQAAKPLRAFFVTSSVEPESSTENCWQWTGF